MKIKLRKNVPLFSTRTRLFIVASCSILSFVFFLVGLRQDGSDNREISKVKFFTLPSGNKMPSIGLGTWDAPVGVVGAVVRNAIQAGYRHIDCAAKYMNEAEIGAALRETIDSEVVEREELFITSKLWNTMHRPEHVELALRKTLSDLNLDYLDLYLVHFPVVQDKDKEYLIPLEQVPTAETWKAMEDCVSKGLVKDIGVSNFSVKKLSELLKVARIPPAVNQIERHPYLQNPELYSFCQQHGIHVTAHSPLGSPGSSGKDKSVGPVLQDPAIVSIAAKHDVTPAQVLIRWALECGTSVVPKTTKKERLVENLAQDVVLDKEDMQLIETIDKHYRYLDASFFFGKKSPYTYQKLWDESENGGKV